MLRMFVTSLMLFLAVFPSVSFAGLVTVQEVIAKHDSSAHTLPVTAEDIRRGLEKPQVLEQLRRLGVSENQARARMAALSDQEIRDLVSQASTKQAGGDVVIGLTTILLIVIIVLLLR